MSITQFDPSWGVLLDSNQSHVLEAVIMRFFILFTFGLLVFSASVSGTPLAVGKNVLENGSFETGLADGQLPGWNLSNLSPNQTWELDPDIKRDGRQALKMTGTGSTPQYAGLMYGSVIHLPGPATYRLSFWCKTQDLVDAENLGSTGLLWFWVYPGDKIGGQKLQSLALGVTNGTSDWTFLKSEVTVPCPVTLDPGNWQGFTGTVWLDDVRIEKTGDPGPTQTNRGLTPVVLAARFPNAPRSYDNLFIALTAPPVMKITRKITVDDGALSAGTRARITLAQNEHEALQVILAPLTDNAVQLELSASALRTAKGKVVPGATVSVRPVGYTGLMVDGKIISEPWPDPLLEDSYVQLEPGKLQPLWVDVFVPRGTKAGAYQTLISLKLSEAVVMKYPIDVTVYDFVLPGRPTLPMTVTASCPSASRLLMSHRIGDSYLCLMREPFGNNDRMYEFGEVRPVIEQALKFEESYGGRQFFMEMPRFPGTFAGGATSIGAFAGWMPSYNKEQRDYIVRYHREYARYLRERKLMDKTMAYLYDEPEPKTFPLIKDLRQLLRTADPGIKAMVVGHLWPELVGTVDVWCPTVLDFDDPKKVEFAKERQAKGEKVWAYNADGPAPPYATWMTDPKCDLLSTRLNFWIVYKLGLDGFLHWACDRNADLARLDSGTDCYMTAGSGAYAQGTGQMIFFGPRPADAPADSPVSHDTAISTIRLEAIRDGLEDFDYFVLLRNALEDAKKRGAKPDKLRQAQSLLRVPDTIAVSFKQYTTDAGRVMGWRHRVARAIEGLKR